MEIDVFCVTPDEELFAQIRENCALYKKWVKSVPAHDGHAILVGGGPSLPDKLSEIRQRQELGQTIFALNGAAGFLNAHGIFPDYQVLLDPQEQLGLLISPAKDYLVASQCHPAVVRAVPDPTLWHLAVEGAEAQVPDHCEDFCIVGGGITVGLSAMCLVYALGYRMLHLYGYDSSAAENGDHAYANAVDTSAHFHSEPELTFTVGNRDFKTTVALAKQAQHFPKLCNDLIDRGCLITVNSAGLIMAVIEEGRKYTLQSAH